MSKVRWFVLGMALLMAWSFAFASQPLMTAPATLNADDSRAVASPGQSSSLDEVTVVYTYDFEDANVEDDWTFSDPAVQPNYWHESSFSPSTNNNWYCSDPVTYPTGGYGDDWSQFLMSPVLDLSGAGTLSLSFMLQLTSEGPDWDGGNVMVLHGADEASAVYDVVAVGTGPAYIGHVQAFGDTWVESAQGWAGTTGDFTTWSEVTMDLSSYNDAYVRVVFAFVSDGNTQAGTGMQVDDIVLLDGETTIWADDADGNNVGGAPEFLSGANAVGDPTVAQNFEIFNNEYDPPSPTHIMGTDTNPIGLAYTHYFTGPEFDLPTVDTGDKLKVNYAIRTGWDNGTADFSTQQYYYVMEIYNPETEVWANVNTIDGGSNYAMNHYLAEGEWTTFAEAYTNPNFNFDITAMQGLEGVRLRIRIRAMGYDLTQAGGYWDNMLFDDLMVEHHTLDHDVGFISTYVPFPRSVGQPISTTTLMANLGPNAETVPAFTWNYGAGIRPVAPSGPYALDVEEAIVLTLDAQLNDGFAGWVPTTAEDVTISFSHTLSPDDIPANNSQTGDVTIMEEGMWELGYDGSLAGTTSNMAYFDEGEGPLVHIFPEAMGGDVAFIGQTITAIKYEIPWSDSWYGAGTTVQYDISILAGGPPPHAALYTSDPIDFTDPSGTGAFGAYWFTHELAEDDQITLEAGEDYYLYLRPLTESASFGYLPFMRAQNATHAGENFASSYYIYDTDTYTSGSSRAWAIRAITEPNMDSNGAPTEFTLDFPGEVVQFPDVGFIWNASMDPEHGPVHYDLTIMSGDDEVVIQNIMDNAFAVNLADTDLGAEPNQEYSWYVTAYDVWGAETQSTETFDFVMADLAPTEFALTAPENETEVSDVSVEFTWAESRSPEGFDVTYTLTVMSGDDEISFDGLTATSETVDLSASDLGAGSFQAYSWYVEAVDSEGRVRMSDEGFEFTMYDVSVAEEALPTEFAVSELYPNPFNPSTSMQVALPNAAPVHVTVFDVLGRQVADLNYGQLAAGRHHLTWGDNTIASGLYVFVVKAGPMQVTRKAVFMK